MREILDILTKYKHKGIKIGLDSKAENLSIKGDLAVLTSVDKEELKASKHDILIFLKENSQKFVAKIPRSTDVVVELPLAPNQKGIWFHEKLEKLGTAYIIPAVYFFELNNFDVGLFETSLSHLVENHDVLRFVFTDKEGIPVQRPKEGFKITDHYSIIEVEKKEMLDSQIEQKSTEQFDYSNQPLWDITIYQLPDSQLCFYLRIHHLIGDGESLNLFIDQVISGYLRLANGGILIPTKELSYSDYVAWISDKGNFSSSTNFWKKEFANYEEDFQLYLDDTNSDSNQNKGETQIYRFGKDQSAKLKAWSQTKRVSLASLYTAATGIVLSKRGRSTDFVIGIPTASRNHPQLVKTIGNFVNILPLRCQIDYSSDEVSFVQSIQQKYVSILDHQMYPFEYILDDIEYDRKINETPLFNVMVSIPNNTTNEVDKKEELELKKTTSLYDLTFAYIEVGDDIELVIEFNTEKFRQETIDSISREIDWVFQQLISNENNTLSNLTLAPKDRLEELFASDLLKKSSKKNSLQSVVQDLKMQATSRPYSTAIVYSEDQITYAELYQSAIRLAQNLVENESINRGERVATILYKSIDSVIAMYAIWLAGGIYVPIDRNLPEERKIMILEDCTAQTTINSEYFQEFRKSNKNISSENTIELPKIEPDSIAYLLYTSGTTGRPKGVIISHQNLANKIEEETSLLEVNGHSVMYGLTNMGFDVSFLETVLPLSYGAKVILPTEEDLKDTKLTIQSIVKYSVTHLQGTPTYFSHFASNLSEESSAELKNLKFICIGGESLNAYLVQQLKSKLPTVQLNNHYGPTEITIDALVKENISEFSRNSIGNSFGQTEAYIVDAQGNLLPENVVGELVIGGPSVFHGYWGDQILTDSKLTVVKFKEGKHYFTGDLVRCIENKEFEFIGRKDKQIKLRGYRIELEDITQTLLSISGVDQAFSKVNDNVLVCWAVSDKEEGLLKSELRQVLPEYMVPQSIELLESFPMTENGKIAVSKLPEPQLLKREYVAPRTELEAKLVDIWKEVLGIEKVGVYDNFFELGGHSLTIIKLQSIFQKEFMGKLDLKDLFQAYTIFKQAGIIVTSTKTEYNSIPKAKINENYPLTSAQYRLWVLNQFEEESSAYTMPEEIRINQKVDTVKFTSVLDNIIQRHEILRTVFKINDAQEPRQKIINYEDFSFELETVDLRHSKDLEGDLQFYITDDKYKSFDLENGPLIRGKLIQLEDESYLFYYNMHHIIADGLSQHILMDDFWRIYESKINDSDPNLPELRIQYKDFSEWEKTNKENGKLENDRRFWLEKFSGEIPVFELPLSKLRPIIKTYAGFSVGKHLPKELSRTLKQFVHDHDGSLFMGLLACLQVLFYKYSENKAAVIGTPFSRREHVDLEHQIGLYIGTLPLLSSLNDHDSYTDVFASAKANLLSALKHQKFSFDQLVEELDVKRDTSRSALFDVLLTLQQTNTPTNCNSKSANILEFGATMTKYDLEITFDEQGDDLFFAINYNSDIYLQDTIESLMMHFEQLLTSMLSSPKANIDSILYLNPTELKELRDLNPDRIEVDNRETVKERFEKQVAMYPNKIAIISNEKEFTFTEINEKVNRLSDFLKTKCDLKPDDLIAVKLGRDEWMIIAILAIAKCGAGYVPISPNFPKERIDFIIEDSNCQFLLDNHELALFISEQARFSKINPLTNSTSSNLAYAIYTSGSTGTPKGVMVENGALISFFENLEKRFGINSDTIFLASTNYVFDISILELLGTLTNGMTIRLVSDSSPEELIEVLRNKEVTSVQLTPSRLNQLMALDPELDMKMNHLDLVLVGGEELKSSHLNFLCSLEARKVFNVYGPTETTIWSTAHQINKTNTKSIGHALVNEEVYILNKYNQLVPKGVGGEICIAGDGLARGYINNVELTTDRFPIHPFRPTQKIYRTGDIGRWNFNDNLEFIGRIDDQVKIRGYRIELGEIESKLLQLTAIESAAVIVRENDVKEAELIAFVTSSDTLVSNDLKDYLKKGLPDYMIPSTFLQIESMPLTPSGKTDRKELKIMNTAQMRSGSKFLSPTTKLEVELVALWEEVLDRDRISLNDSFFDLGGHSLKAIRLLNLVASKLGLVLTITEVFQSQTLKDQASVLERKTNALISTIPAGVQRDNYPLSSGQKRLWLLSQFNEANFAYNMPGILEINGYFQLELLEKALKTILERHEILRTVFKRDESGELRQYVQSVEQVSFAINYKTQYDEAINFDEASAFLQAELAKPFDLERGPLFKVYLVKLENDRYLFAYVMHHIISDAWSMKLLLNETLSLYEGFSNGKQNILEPLTIQYRDYTVWQLEQLKSGQLEKQKVYWLQQFSGNNIILEMPTDFKRPIVKTYSGSKVQKIISTEAYSALTSITNQETATPFMGLVSVVNLLLYKYSGQDEIILGSPVAGRDTKELENQIGFYVNMIALKTKINRKESFKDLLKSVKMNSLSAFEHQDYPFDELIDNLNLSRDTSRSALFDVIVTMEVSDPEKSDKNSVNNLKIRPLGDGKHTISKFDLSFNFIEVGGEILLDLEYNDALFKKETAEQLVNHFEQLLSVITTSSNIPIDDIQFLTKEEENHLTKGLNDLKLEYDLGQTLVSQFIKQVKKTPNKCAIECKGHSMTYLELDNQSNAFTQYLRITCDVQPNHLVGVKMERSINLIVSILAVLKSGAAYVPIDVNYPQERIEFIESDSGCSSTITDKVFEQFLNHKIINTDVEQAISPVANDLAYIIYTSGTTGNPKGVQIRHSNAVALIEWATYEFKETDFEVMYAATSHCFDLSVFEIFFPLATGKKIKLLENSLEIGPELCKDQKVLINTVPSSMRSLLDSGYSIASVVAINLAGEVFPVDIAHRLLKEDVELRNLYGPSEDTTYSTCYRLSKNTYDTIPIGKAVSNSQVYVLDKGLKPIPFGVKGRLFLGGSGVASGYLNQPELTNDKFIDNPFQKGTILYDTGDLASWKRDGKLEFFVREDTQVKLRGYRIELEEIEKAILEGNETIVQAIVVMKKIGNTDSLIAYLVGDKEVSAETIKENLKRKIPSYMIPNSFIYLLEIPTTINGKIDRLELMNHSITTSHREYHEPHTEQEHQLVQLWSEVLNLEQVGITDDFFELGGNSLLFVTIYENFKSRFGSKVDLAKFYTSTTIREQVKYIHDNSDIDPSHRNELENRLPSYVEYYWTKAKASPKSKNVSFGISSSSTVSFERLQKAFDYLCERHKVLKTRVVEEEGSVRLEEFIEPNIIVLTQGVSRDQALKKCAEVHDTKFELADESLAKAFMFDLDDGKTILFFSIPHLVFDGFSLTVFWRDLFEAYEQNDRLASLDYQFVEAGLRREILTISNNLDSTYWLDFFGKTTPALNFHTKCSDVNHSGQAIEITFDLNSNFLDSFESFCKDLNISNNNFFLGVIALLIHEESAAKDFTFCFDHHSRNEENIDQIGFWVQSIFTEVSITDCSIEAFFKQVNEQVMASMSHTNVDILKLIQHQHGGNYEERLLELKRLRFNYYDESSMNIDLNEMDYEHLYFNNTHLLPIYLHFFTVKMQQGITMNIMANDTYFDRDNLDDFRKRFVTLFEHTLKANRGQKLGEFLTSNKYLRIQLN